MSASHGSVAGYNAGCRLECCRAAWRRYRKGTRDRAYLRGPLTVDALGTVRRIQALARLGYSLSSLDRELGWKPDMCSYLLRQDAVFRSTADAISELYERLSGTAPTGWLAEKQRRQAEAKGWAGPLAWVDIDDPTETPDAGWRPRQYRSAELVSEWDYLRRAGVSIDSAASQLGVSVGAIEKAMERLEKAA